MLYACEMRWESGLAMELIFFGEEIHCESPDPFLVSSKETRRCSSTWRPWGPQAFAQDGSNPKIMCRVNISGGAAVPPFPTMTCRQLVA